MIQDIGSLSDVNGYTFENMNGQLRDFVNGSNNVGKQIAKKSELQFSSKLSLAQIESDAIEVSPKPKLKFKSKLDSKLNRKIQGHFQHQLNYQYSTLHYNNVYYTSKSYTRETKACNSVVCLKNNKFLSIFCFIEHNNEVYAIGEEMSSVQNVYCEFSDHFGQCNLSLPHIHEVQMSSSSEIVNIKEFSQKCFFVDFNNKQYCIMINNKYAF